MKKLLAFLYAVLILLFVFGCEKEDDFRSSSLELDISQLEIAAWSTSQLKVSVAPPVASQASYKWHSCNEDVTSVDSQGNIKGLYIGEDTIVVSAEYRGQTLTDTCFVSVYPVLIGEVERDGVSGIVRCERIGSPLRISFQVKSYSEDVHLGLAARDSIVVGYRLRENQGGIIMTREDLATGILHEMRKLKDGVFLKDYGDSGSFAFQVKSVVAGVPGMISDMRVRFLSLGNDAPHDFDRCDGSVWLTEKEVRKLLGYDE